MKKILNLKGAKKLSSIEQKMISGGFWGCQPELRICNSDHECPCGPCGFTVDGPTGPIDFFDICAF